MSLKITVAVMAVLGSGAAYANPCTGSNTVNCNAGNGNITSQTQGQGQNAYGGTASSVGGSQGQGQTATGGSVGNTSAAGGSGGSANQGITTTDSGNTYIPRAPVNTALAGFQETTAACWHAEGVGVQTAPAGAAVGFTFRDHECMKYTIAMSLYARGKLEAADRLMCSMKEVKLALGDDCLSIVATVYTAEPVKQPDYVTQDELNQVVKKLLRK